MIGASMTGAPMIGRLLVAWGFALSGVVMIGTPAQACSCVQLDTAREATGATHVFVGTVTGGQQRAGQLVHEVDVSEVYKGEVPEVVELHTAVGSGSCGLRSLPGGRPIAFFATSTRGDLVSDSCSGTAPVTAELSGDLSAELGDPADRNGTGAATVATGASTTEASTNAADDGGGPLWPGLTAVLLLAVGAGAWTARRTT